MRRLWWQQIQAVVQLELKKTFFAKRGLWIYLLALAPVALFLTHSLVELHLRGARHQIAQKSARPLTELDLAAIHEGMSREQVVAVLGPPPVSLPRIRRNRKRGGAGERVNLEVLRYSDGDNELSLSLEGGTVIGVGRTSGVSLGQDSYVFAGVFQFFFLRLAIFFGCLGIFMNLFRGEMVDKSLHFYFLAPVRREVLMVGKYLAGLLAATAIFTTSTALQLVCLLLDFDSNSVSHYLYRSHGWEEIGAYLGVTVLACIGYGSIFLAAGLLFRNPIIPAAAVLIWEAANPVLPQVLKKVSVIYYLKSLCPVNLPIDPGMPALLALLASNPAPMSGYLAVSGLLVVSVLVLVLSAKRVHNLEINYTIE